MFFISDAYAQTAPAARPAGGAAGWSSILFMGAIFVVFYFLLIRPQVKRQKEHKTLIEGLSKGDEILTSGGMVGKITDIDAQYLRLQVATVNDKAVEISVQRSAVSTLLAQGNHQVAVTPAPVRSARRRRERACCSLLCARPLLDAYAISDD